MDIVVTLGGDGTVNEVVNGMKDPDVTNDGVVDDTVAAEHLPLLAPVPGGSANVFARALGLPRDPVEAAGEILASVNAGSTRRISLGSASATTADGTAVWRWFTANAGLGIDARVIEAMERQRDQGHTATPARYLRTVVGQFFGGADRSHPHLTVRRTLEHAGAQTVDGVFWAIVQNTSPWTYLGPLAIDACPDASFDTGLDLFALRRMGLVTAARASRRLLAGSRAGSTKRSITTWHDTDQIAIDADSPMPMQVDGERLVPVTAVRFASHPAALTTVRPLTPDE